ncbi:TrmD tRNA-(guanine-N1)-methyltransferase [Rhabdaerophilaceae bacterium]
MSGFAATVLTLMPDMFPGTLGLSLAGDALAKDVWSLTIKDIRDHGIGRHRAVDDTPAGGGPGMVIRADVLCRAIDAVVGPDDPRPRFLMSPRGRVFDQTLARSLAQGPGAILVCGRFEGVDERAILARALTELSIGDYVLSGGEIAAQVVLDSVVRLLPGVMGGDGSDLEESHENGLLEYPHYTRPRDFERLAIPEILTSGNHARIAAWRREQAEALTRERRPDLFVRKFPEKG